MVAAVVLYFGRTGARLIAVEHDYELFKISHGSARHGDYPDGDEYDIEPLRPLHIVNEPCPANDEDKERNDNYQSYLTCNGVDRDGIVLFVFCHGNRPPFCDPQNTIDVRRQSSPCFII